MRVFLPFTLAVSLSLIKADSRTGITCKSGKYLYEGESEEFNTSQTPVFLAITQSAVQNFMIVKVDKHYLESQCNGTNYSSPIFAKPVRQLFCFSWSATWKVLKQPILTTFSIQEGRNQLFNEPTCSTLQLPKPRRHPTTESLQAQIHCSYQDVKPEDRVMVFACLPPGVSHSACTITSTGSSNSTTTTAATGPEISKVSPESPGNPDGKLIGVVVVLVVLVVSLVVAVGVFYARKGKTLQCSRLPDNTGSRNRPPTCPETSTSARDYRNNETNIQSEQAIGRNHFSLQFIAPEVEPDEDLENSSLDFGVYRSHDYHGQQMCTCEATNVDKFSGPFIGKVDLNDHLQQRSFHNCASLQRCENVCLAEMQDTNPNENQVKDLNENPIPEHIRQYFIELNKAD